MSREKLIGSYLLRFVEKNHQQHCNLHNLHTGERLEFDTWVAAWAFLDHWLDDSPTRGRSMSQPRCNAATTPAEED
jgi:hypothetical protein